MKKWYHLYYEYALDSYAMRKFNLNRHGKKWCRTRELMDQWNGRVINFTGTCEPWIGSNLVYMLNETKSKEKTTVPLETVNDHCCI